jgi:hypothetical protein
MAARPGLPEREGTGARWLSHFMKSGRLWRHGGIESMPESLHRHSASSMATGRTDDPKAAPMRKPCADGSTASSAGQTCGAVSASGYTYGYGAVRIVGPKSRRWHMPCPLLLRQKAMTGPHEADQGSCCNTLALIHTWENARSGSCRPFPRKNRLVPSQNEIFPFSY